MNSIWFWFVTFLFALFYMQPCSICFSYLLLQALPPFLLSFPSLPFLFFPFSFIQIIKLLSTTTLVLWLLCPLFRHPHPLVYPRPRTCPSSPPTSPQLPPLSLPPLLLYCYNGKSVYTCEEFRSKHVLCLHANCSLLFGCQASYQPTVAQAHSLSIRSMHFVKLK